MRSSALLVTPAQGFTYADNIVHVFLVVTGKA